MKIEVGKVYETRHGKLVRVICTDAKDEKYPVVGLLGDTIRESVYRWTIDGCFFSSRKVMESPLDLIREHVPVTYRWHNIYPSMEVGPGWPEQVRMNGSTGLIKLAFDPSGNLIPDKCEITGAQPSG